MEKLRNAGAKSDKGGGSGWLDRVERLGNRLPDPVAIFLILIAVLIGLSAIASSFGWSAVNPSNGEVLQSKSLLSVENVRRILVDMPATFTGFKPLGMVLVVMLGAAIAERSGLFAALMNRAIRNVGGQLLTPAIFFIGLMSHHADDAAYVVIIPLAALAFAQAGRHPLAGVAIAYAGISGAFAANLLPGQFDVLILGITQTAAHFVDPNYGLNPLGNWWFTATLGMLLIPITWFVNDRIVEPRLGTWTGAKVPEPLEEERPHTAALEGKALRRAGLAALFVVGIFAALTIFPDYQPLVDQEAEGPARLAPFYASFVAGFALLFAAAGWAYGSVVGSITSHRDVVRMMARGLEATTPYLVLAFFAAHFIALFAWSNLGPILAIKGADVLTHLNAPVALLLIILLILSSAFDLAIGSASAKWTAMAPIVVPMLMLIGVSPEMTTAAYRMGDSVFNIVTPVASNFALVLVLAQRWRHDFGIGSLIALMLPFSMAIGLTGLSLIAIWATFELPTGPGAVATYVAVGAR
jgi:aminobenzoyl-glutamate transport protein